MSTGETPMWTIYAGDVCIDHPNLYDQGRVVTDVEIDMEINTHGSMQFTVPITNPGYDTVKQLGTVVVAKYNGETIFRGRVSDTTKDFYNNMEIYAEGQLAFLCDSTLQPFTYKGTVADFLKFILDTHNSEVEDYKKLYLGTVTVTDPDNNGVLVRSSESSISSWDAISKRLIDALGGYILVREAGGKFYVDYLAELTEKSGQTVEFSQNLLDLDEHIDSKDVATVLYPFGAKVEEDGTNENTYDKYQEEPEGAGLTVWNGNRVTVREANNGVMYVEDTDGINLWGRIWATNVWDEVTLPSNLLKKAKAWLKEKIKSTTTIELNAVDLHIVDVDIDDIRLGEIVHVKSAPHDLETDMPCLKQHIEPGAPDKSTVTLGATPTALTKYIAAGGTNTTLQEAKVYADRKASEAKTYTDAQATRIDKLDAENVTINGRIDANEASIDALEADNVTIKDTLTANKAEIDSLEATKISAETADAKYATIENLNATNADIDNLSANYAKFETTTTDKLTAIDASITNLDATKISAEIADAKYATIETLEATNADIDNLNADYATFKTTTTDSLTAIDANITDLNATKISAEIADAKYATIENLKATNADINNLNADYATFKTTTTDSLTAIDASITDLNAKKLDAESAEIQYANIDFSNIGKAAFEYFYSKSGLIKDVIIGDGTVTGELVGVTIKGDLIEGNTIKAEKLVIKGTDGLYYKLNTDGVTTEAEQTTENALDGSYIIAKSITATKIAVDDLVAFDATIGGFNITSDAIYSGVKESPTNTTRGIYMDKQGQMALGDSSNYLRYYKAQDGSYKLEISAGSITMSSSGTTVEAAIADAKSSANNYTDSKVSGANTYTDTQVSGAKSYADTQIAASEQTAANTYATKSSVSQTASEIRSEVSAAQTSANNYTDSKVSGANSYTDTQVSGAKSYADTQIAASEKTAANTYATQSSVSQRFDNITLSVTDGSVGNTAKIKLGIDGKTREASIDLTGAVSFSDLSTAGKTTINGSNITTGTLSADRIDAAALFAKDVTTTGNFQINNGGHGIRLEDGVFKVGYGVWNSLAKWGYISFNGNTMSLNTIGTGGQINITSATGVNITGTTTINGLQTTWLPQASTWTPTVAGASSYSIRKGYYIKFSTTYALVGFEVYGSFGGSTTSRISITGCPVSSANGQASGGGHLSGYYSASNVVFTGWNMNKAGTIYAVGQQTGTTGATWGSTAIYQKSSGDFSAAGTLFVQIS